ncbi:CXXX repeat peptide modification system protein [Paenibacillus peoriae]|jgi:CXXX repeat modification system protein|uniref:CXXX repeat peptide modification system protein n=1 Tax=Paenibacillus TaxID=44249 RepID=UPI0030FCE70A
MKNEMVGVVLESEKEEILQLYERKTALQELINSFNDAAMIHDDLYERIVKDLGQTMVAMENWWSCTSKKYQWKRHPSSNWTIDFNTNEINLVMSEVNA